MSNAEFRVSLPEDTQNWLLAFARATGKSPDSMIEAGLRLYRDNVANLGLDSLILRPQVQPAGPASRSRSTQNRMLVLVEQEPEDLNQQIEATMELVNDLENRLEFVGFGYVAGGPMQNRGIAPDKRGCIAVLNEMIERGILISYKVDNKFCDGDPVTAIKLNDENDQVIDYFGEEEEGEGKASGEQDAPEAE